LLPLSNPSSSSRVVSSLKYLLHNHS